MVDNTSLSDNVRLQMKSETSNGHKLTRHFGRYNYHTPLPHGKKFLRTNCRRTATQEQP